ncbi:MAG TPA: hypothetical protein VD788_15665, partial [Candidatus Polarisedimenticolaceae bacterium]|nr:hypothetical protein [Candidatus Polarisedimenticolaceae bacterium]
DRVRAALADDGTRGVFRLARAAQGDHAAARYLRELVRQRELDPDQLLTVLQLAAERVDNTAECQGLLASIVKRYDLDTPVLRAAFARAKARLGPRAAIDTFGRRSDTRAASR